MDLNVVTLVGRLTRDVELKYVGANNMAVAEVGLAVNGRGKGDDRETSFVDVTFWGKTAEILAEFTHKGSLIGVSGRIKQDRWEKDGEKRSKITVVAENLQLLTPKDSSVPTESVNNSRKTNNPVKEDDSVPF